MKHIPLSPSDQGKKPRESSPGKLFPESKALKVKRRQREERGCEKMEDLEGKEREKKELGCCFDEGEIL